MVNVYSAKLDLKTIIPKYNPVFVQYDNARLEIELLDNGKTYDLSTTQRVEFTHVRPDKLTIIQPGEIITNGNKKIIRYDYLGTEMEVLGRVETSFSIFDPDNKKVSSPSFIVEIKKDLRDEVFNPAEPNFGKLQTLIDDVEYLKENGGGGSGGVGPPGRDGKDGINGQDGIDGKSAYQIAVSNGFVGTEAEWLLSLKGERGEKGEQGSGEGGGESGRDGIDGKSAFEIAVENGYIGSETEWLESLRGPQGVRGLPGEPGYTPRKNIDYFDGKDGKDGAKGEPFTYADFTPTQLEALRGPKGRDGKDGKSFTFEDFTPEQLSTLKGERGLPGSPGYTPQKNVDYFDGQDGIDGKSAYEIAVDEGFTGTETEWLASLKAETSARPPIKILSIGNSFSEDAHSYLDDIFASVGVDAVIGNLFRNGESLQGHWTQANTNASSYTYNKRVSDSGTVNTTSRANTSMEYGILDEEWDVITFQQASHDSGNATTFQPHLNNLILYVKARALNPNVKLALHMTWSYASNSTNGAFAIYNNDQMTMYNYIAYAYQKAMEGTGIDILIPSGTSIQNARTNDFLLEQDNELTRDALHLGGTGQYIAALTFFESLYAQKYGIDIFSDVSFTPVSTEEGRFLSYLSKVAVKNAVANPINVTNPKSVNIGNKFEWRYNPTTNSLDLVVLS